jgi:hypothetical protein
MSPHERQMARQRGQRKLDAMRRRTGQLRRRVVAAAVLGFVLLWTVVFVQMATGNDPALGTGAPPLAVKKKRASDLERRWRQAAVPPPIEEEDEESAPAEEPETSEAAAVEAEQIEAARVEAEQQREAEALELAEAEARELEELETVTTGQS